MKRIAFICLIFITACSEDQEIDKLKGQWTVSWKIAGEEITGDLLLYQDHHAILRVNGVANSLLIKKPEAVDFYWWRDSNSFVLKRRDNDIELKYQIINESPDRMQLAFAEDITVTLSRN